MTCFHPQKTAREQLADHIKICRNGVSIKSNVSYKPKYDYAKTKNRKSPIENRLFTAMKKKNLNPVSQYKILNFKVDFAFLEQKLVVECDGSEYHGDSGTLWARNDYESRRHYLIKKEGWTILRYTGYEIHHNADMIAYRISRAIKIRSRLLAAKRKQVLT